ncbi:MAG: hypothetical protein ACNI26_14965 [Terasakiella sp.]|uniref:hypothetical protein n=1 Tax=unclassified Terasakiella TaxID=2614952 RepID=UPI003B00D341
MHEFFLFLLVAFCAVYFFFKAKKNTIQALNQNKSTSHMEELALFLRKEIQKNTDQKKTPLKPNSYETDEDLEYDDEQMNYKNVVRLKVKAHKHG